jgi:beta-aspartyl-peptidase (threonine type)
MPIALAVHGGAWNIPDDSVPEHLDGITEALALGWAMLEAGRSSLDVVEHVIRMLEDNPTFDAGRGARLTRAGKVELDASIMEGGDLNAGAVAAVQGIRNPISLARRVMEKTDHVMLVGAGAKAFARSEGLPVCQTRSLLVGRELNRYLRVRDGERSLIHHEFSPAGPMGTVGVVVIDCKSHIAAGTSTGGIQDKLPGRVGDTPIPGSGTYADDRLGAASSTGHGEAIMRVMLAKTAVDSLQGRVRPETAAKRALRTLDRVHGFGGLILLDRRGRPAAAFNTPRMARGFGTRSDGMRVGVDRRMKKI